MLNNKTYDYVITGGGPCGLTLAYCLGTSGKSVLVIDKNDSIGGCNRVTRVDKLFTEHSPRIYSSNYINTKMLLKHMNINMDDIFTKYKFNISEIGGDSISNLSLREILCLSWEFIKLIIYSNHGVDTSMNELMSSCNFSPNTKSYIDKLCRLTDGAGSDRYTLHQFLQLLNQQLFYTISQPIKPNDVLLFDLWVKQLANTKNVDIILNTQVVELNATSDKITNIIAKDKNNTFTINGDKFIFAIPPKQLVQLFSSSHDTNIQNAFGNINKLNEFAENNAYNEYISVVFHWNYKLKLKSVWGFPNSDWNVAFITMSDYMNFENNQSQTVISTAVTNTNAKSKFTGKTANESSKEEIIAEVFRQLKEAYPDLPKASHSIMYPKVSYDNNHHNWLSSDSAYIATNSTSIDFNSFQYKNLYNVGTHNGRSLLNFTSFESAVTNALALQHELSPETQKMYPINGPFTLIDMIYLLLVLLILFMIYKQITLKLF